MFIGKNIHFFEDLNDSLTILNIQKPEIQSRFKKGTKDIFAHPAIGSAFWFKFSVSNHCAEDLWLEIGSTYAWYIDLYVKDSLDGFTKVAETGTMRPENTKFYDHNLFWLPLNKAKQSKVQNYYLRISAALPLEIPLHIGTIRSLSKQRDISNYLTAGFIGLMLIVFLYSLFIYFSTKDHVYIWYLGYLFLMGISMPYANSHPFIQKINFLFMDKQWWNNYFLVWHSPVYFFIGMFCIKYLNLKEQLPFIYKTIIAEITLLCIVAPLLNVFGFGLVNIINSFQVLVLLLYLTCLFTAYYLIFKGNKYARFYVLGWTFMIIHVFIFFATVNGYFPYSNYSRNALYFGVGLEVWMFSLALGDRMNLIRLEKEFAQNKYLDLVKSQNETLQKNVNERTAQLEEALEELESANSELMAQSDQLAEMNNSKDKLFSILGHDLRSPIASLKVILELVVNKTIGAEEFNVFANKFKLKIDNVLFLLNNLFQWANTQKNGIVTKPTSILLHNIIEQNIEILTINTEMKKIKINNNVSEDLYVFCDMNQINIIILNLLNNAVKFTRKDGIIAVDTEIIDNKFVQISIQDNGLGMDAETQKNIFNPYHQISTAGTDGETGTGLGLSLCKDFVESNGGTIRIESATGIGSTFYFTLPLSAQLKGSLN